MPVMTLWLFGENLSIYEREAMQLLWDNWEPSQTKYARLFENSHDAVYNFEYLNVAYFNLAILKLPKPI